MKLIDNNIETLKDNLILTIQSGSKLSIAASCFSMYAFNELMEQLKGVDELRFIFTSPTFVNNETGRRKNRTASTETNSSNIYGSSFETQLRNALMQKAIAQECAEWIKSDKVSFRSIASNELISGYAVVQSQDKKDAHVYTPLQGFTTVDLGCSDKKGVVNLIQELDTPFAKQYLSLFDSIWKDKKKLVDVKQELLESTFVKGKMYILIRMALMKIAMPMNIYFEDLRMLCEKFSFYEINDTLLTLNFYVLYYKRKN